MSPVVVLTFPDFSLFKKQAQITFYSPYGKKRDSADQQIKMTYDYMTIARTWVATRKVLGIAFAHPHYNWFPNPTQKPNQTKSSSRGWPSLTWPRPPSASDRFGGRVGSGPPWWLNIVVAFQEGAFARCLSKGNGGKLFIQSAANVVQAARVNRRTRSLSSIFYLSEVAIFLRAI